MVTPVTAESMFEIRKKILNHPIINLHHTTNTNVIYNLCQLIINLTVVNADWKEVWYNAVKRNWTITYFTSV
jgi:hypothetical protein